MIINVHITPFVNEISGVFDEIGGFSKKGSNLINKKSRKE
jgi:hypothetical protein